MLKFFKNTFFFKLVSMKPGRTNNNTAINAKDGIICSKSIY